MTDTQLRGIVLRKLYDKRKMGLVELRPGEIEGVDHEDVKRICHQLAEQRLINWKATMAGGYGGISAFGVDVVEGTATPLISVTFDQSISVQNSSGVQIGNANVQQTFIDIDRLVSAINSSSASDAEKQRAKSLLTQFLEHPVVAAIVGALAGRVGGA